MGNGRSECSSDWRFLEEAFSAPSFINTALTHISENVALEAALDQMRVNSSGTKLACSHGAEHFSEVTWVQLVLFEDGRELTLISIAFNFPKVLDRYIGIFSGNIDDSIFVFFRQEW